MPYMHYNTERDDMFATGAPFYIYYEGLLADVFIYFAAICFCFYHASRFYFLMRDLLAASRALYARLGISARRCQETHC